MGKADLRGPDAPGDPRGGRQGAAPDYPPADGGLVPGDKDEPVITCGGTSGLRGFYTRDQRGAIAGVDLADCAPGSRRPHSEAADVRWRAGGSSMASPNSSSLVADWWRLGCAARLRLGGRRGCRLRGGLPVHLELVNVQRRLGGCCLLSARPMMAAFSSWLSSRLAGLRLGTIENTPGRRAGPAGYLASDGGAGGGVARSGSGAGPACCACSAARARSRVWIVWARSAARSSAARRRVRSSSKACSSSRTRSSTDWPAVRPLEGPFCCAWSGVWAWRGRSPAASSSWVGMRQRPR